MPIEIQVTPDRCTTQFAPVGVLAVYYQRQKVLEPFQCVVPPVKKRRLSAAKSTHAGAVEHFDCSCEYLSLANSISQQIASKGMYGLTEPDALFTTAKNALWRKSIEFLGLPIPPPSRDPWIG